MKKIITSYENPDLDGVASMYAYSEYLNSNNIQNAYYIYGKEKQEVDIVCRLFNIKLNPVSSIENEQKIIIVDTNNMEEVKFVNPKDVVEIIDHHSKNKTSEKCTNAKMQIERIGAVATLIAERFKKNKVPISRESAILLYYGIISNSINLKAKVTSKKDIKMANWLKEQCPEISEDKIKEIFEQKSKIDEKNLRTEMEAENIFYYKDKKIIIAQLEIVNIKEFIEKYEENIKDILIQIKKEKKLDYIFINCIDILNGYNIILTIDENTEILLNKIFGYKFKKNKCKIKRIMQRKDLSRKIREESNKKYYAYMLRCSDGTIYSGYTTDPYRREKVHNSGKGAKYTRARLPVKLEYFEEFDNKIDAMKREYALKQYTHKEKERIINGKGEVL